MKKCAICKKRWIKQQEWKKEMEKNICPTCQCKIKSAISKLVPREQKVLEMRFGIKNGMFTKGKTLEEVGEEFGVTRERIRQIEAKALEGIQNLVGDF
jgi:DNA-directed RNA polymerase sigma subunit (sigma70/sigma32)